MAFKATNILPDKGYDRAKQTATGLKKFCTNLSAELSTGGNSTQVLGVVDSLVSFKTNLLAVKSIPGIGKYAQNQEDDPTYDAALEFTGLIDIINIGIDAVMLAFPVNSGGYLLAYKFNANGKLIPRSITGAQLVPVRTALDNIAAQVV